MTENEAKLLEKLDDLANDLEVDMYSVAALNAYFEECGNAIRGLLEEIQQYRAIGLTPNEIYVKIGTYNAELTKYVEIGTVEECRAAMEKMKPSKVKRFKKKGEVLYQCGVCSRDVFIHEKYCVMCGQAIDWSN